MRSSYGPLIRDLPLSLADSSYSEVEPEVSTSADTPNSKSTGPADAKFIDYTDVSASASGQPADGADGKATKDESAAASPLMPAKLIKSV